MGRSKAVLNILFNFSFPWPQKIMFIYLWFFFTAHKVENLVPVRVSTYCLSLAGSQIEVLEFRF